MPVLEAAWTLLTTPLTSFFIIGFGLCLWIFLKPLFTDPLKSADGTNSLNEYELKIWEGRLRLKERELQEREWALDQREEKLDRRELKFLFGDDDDDDDEEEENLSLRLRIDRMNPGFRRWKSR